MKIRPKTQSLFCVVLLLLYKIIIYHVYRPPKGYTIKGITHVLNYLSPIITFFMTRTFLLWVLTKLQHYFHDAAYEVTGWWPSGAHTQLENGLAAHPGLVAVDLLRHPLVHTTANQQGHSKSKQHKTPKLG
jgi:hypothetical protein